MTQPVLLAVCLGNICRSPTAEAALRQAANDAGVDVVVRSAGTGSWHVGEPPDRRMQAAARAAGLELSGVAEQVDPASLRDADLVLAMDQNNLRDLQLLAAEHAIETPIRLFRDFDPECEDKSDVPDPYQGGEEGFAEVVRIVMRTAHQVIAGLESGTLFD